MKFSKLVIANSLTMLIILGEIHAQHFSERNKIWAFGYKAGIDFSSGIPVPFISGLDYFFYSEGNASVCDTMGNLLFYSNGFSVYNRHHSLMPHGDTIAPYITYSTTQAALIAPVIGSSNKYYIFSLSEYYPSVPASGRLSYSIVDMSLDGGNGDVIPSTTGTMLDSSLSEKMIAITGNNHNIWILMHRRDTSIFLAYEITAAGITASPIISSVGNLSGHSRYATGVMKISPNRRKLVVQCHDHLMLGYGGSELYNFDPTTGKVTNCVVIDSINDSYGAEFSPDDTKLYTQESHTADTMKIYQYNVKLASPSEIRSSKILIAQNYKRDISDLKLGPDGKIYFLGTDDSVDILGNNYLRYLDCISSPNISGTMCGYTPHIVKFLPGTGAQFGFPNLYVSEDTITTTAIYDIFSEFSTDVSIYPNPGTKELTVYSANRIDNIFIYNLLGEQILHRMNNSNSIRIDISTFPPNTYFVKVNNIPVKSFTKL